MCVDLNTNNTKKSPKSKIESNLWKSSEFVLLKSEKYFLVTGPNFSTRQMKRTRQEKNHTYILQIPYMNNTIHEIHKNRAERSRQSMENYDKKVIKYGSLKNVFQQKTQKNLKKKRKPRRKEKKLKTLKKTEELKKRKTKVKREKYHQRE